jgi:hypothetical protein
VTTFSQFLLDRGLVSAEALLAALVRHVESQPPLCALVQREQLLPVADQLRILEHQAATGVSYVEALAAHGLWSDPLRGVLLERAREAATPLGELLIKAGALDWATLNRAVDEFVGEAVAPPSLAAPATEPDPALLEEFLQLFDDQRCELLESMIEQWDGDRMTALTEAILAVVSEWEPIRAGAAFVQADALAAVIELAAKAMRAAAATPDLATREVKHLTAIAQEVTQLAWTLRDRMRTRAGEPPFAGDTTLRERYEATMARLGTIDGRAAGRTDS